MTPSGCCRIWKLLLVPLVADHHLEPSLALEQNIQHAEDTWLAHSKTKSYLLAWPACIARLSLHEYVLNMPGIRSRIVPCLYMPKKAFFSLIACVKELMLKACSLVDLVSLQIMHHQKYGCSIQRLPNAIVIIFIESQYCHHFYILYQYLYMPR